ncbi:hypothetical protein BSKO_06767 [Bryopsis sp. KO-2023]|nr:hypothetical protein BSKO_06767 [Bryopsis sp. KO-2023]
MNCAPLPSKVLFPGRHGQAQPRLVASTSRCKPVARLSRNRAVAADDVATQAESVGMTFVPLHGDFGADVQGVDLKGGISEAQGAVVKDALDRFRLLRFRGHDITPDEETQLLCCLPHDEEALRKGELESVFKPTLPGHSHIFVQYKDVIDDDYHGLTLRPKPPTPIMKSRPRWHCDCSGRVSPRYTYMHMRVVPERGGNTLFTSGVKAYERLTDDQKSIANKLRARYYTPRLVPKIFGMPGAEELPAKNGFGYQDAALVEKILGKGLEEGDVIDCEGIPFVVEEEGSGARSMFIHPNMFHRFEGMSAEESQAILDKYLAPAVPPERVWSAEWEAGDIIIWKNWQMLHVAPPWGDYEGLPRLFHQALWDAVPTEFVE